MKEFILSLTAKDIYMTVIGGLLTALLLWILRQGRGMFFTLIRMIKSSTDSNIKRIQQDKNHEEVIKSLTFFYAYITLFMLLINCVFSIMSPESYADKGSFNNITNVVSTYFFTFIGLIPIYTGALLALAKMRMRTDSLKPSDEENSTDTSD